MSIPWLKILKYGLPVLVLAGIVWGIYSLGSSHGEAVIQAKWDKQKAADTKMVEAEKAKIATDEQVHRAEDRRISDELVAAKEKAAAATSAAQLATAGRLRDSEQRAALYRSQAEAGATERANLASYAAQLDRSLSTGIGLVEELRAALELRDGQIRQLAAQIKNDRQLISGQSATDADSAAPAQ